MPFTDTEVPRESSDLGRMLLPLLTPVAIYFLQKLNADPTDYAVTVIIVSAVCFDAYQAGRRWFRAEQPHWPRNSPEERALKGIIRLLVVLFFLCHVAAFFFNRTSSLGVVGQYLSTCSWGVFLWVATLGVYLQSRKADRELPPVQTFSEEFRPLQSAQWKHPEQ